MQSIHLATLTKYLEEEKVLNLIDLKENASVITMPEYSEFWDIRKINKHYRFKYLENVLNFVNELIGSLLSQKLGLDTISYLLATDLIFDKKRNIYRGLGLASKDFKEEGWKYYSPLQTHGINNFLEYVRILNKSETETKIILDNLARLFALDIYSGQTDRNCWNIYLKSQNGVVRLGPLYDFELSFTNMLDVYETCFFKMEYATELKKYLELIPGLEEYLNRLFAFNIKRVLEEIEDTYKIILGEDLKDYYGAYIDENTKRLSRIMGR